jgi:uncharacterized membrane protein YhaH (DUF805 family)
MDFVGAIQSGFRNYANFRGVAKRSEYWYWVLFTFLTGLVAAALERITGAAIFSSLVSGAVFIPNLAVSVRRLRDSGRTWLWLLTPIPGLALFVVGLVMAAFNLYDFGYITTSQQLNDPNFPSSALIEQVIADSRFYQGFIMIVAGLILSFVFTVLTNIIFMALPSKSAAEGNKRVPPSF